MLDAAKEFSIFGSSGGPELANQASRVVSRLSPPFSLLYSIA